MLQVKSVVLINCGGCLNLLELLQPSEQEEEDEESGGGTMGGVRGHQGVTFFIVDSRRPLELDNVYNQDQVHVVLKEGEELELPEFDDIYASDMVRMFFIYITMHGCKSFEYAHKCRAFLCLELQLHVCKSTHIKFYHLAEESAK